MRLRSLQLALLTASVLTAPASSQITIEAAESSAFYPGAGQALTYDSTHETDQEAVDALIAQAGPDQIWDFTALGLELDADLMPFVDRRDGSVGPGADGEFSPLEQATDTYVLAAEDGDTSEGAIYGYYRLAGDGLHLLGALITGEFGGEVVVGLGTVYQPEGALEAPPTYTYGSTWSSSYTEFVNGAGGLDIDASYEVDGWGEIRVPGVASAIPALRVKITREPVGSTQPSDVTYEFRTTAGVRVYIDPDESSFGFDTQVQVGIVTGSSGTVAEDDARRAGFELGAPYPNPARGPVTFDVAVPTAMTATVAVYDVLGRVVVEAAPVALASGGAPVRVDVSGLPAGLYVVRVEVDGRVLARPLTVIR